MNQSFEHLSSKYVLLRDCAQSFFSGLRESIKANTFFLAENDGSTNRILHVWNHEETLVTEGMELPFESTYCSAVCSMSRSVIIENTAQSPFTKDLPVTRQTGACSFLGVPIVLRNGRLFGTICALDRIRVFTREDLKQVERMADFISRLLDLEETIVYDELTGLYRRGYLELLFYNLPAESKKAVAYLDLDDFKKINDTYGREAGDQVLRRVGTVLGNICSRHHAHACRYAGDKFVLLFASEADDKIIHVLDKLMEDLSQPITVSGYPLFVTASIGLCSQAATFQQYIQRADTAMYEIKRGAKFGIQVFTMTGWDKTLEFSLNRAIEEQRFQLVYQPIVDSKQATTAAIEARIRWETTEHGKLGPEMFLPFAEKIGLIEKIDLWVIREACSQLLSLPDWEQCEMTIRVNCSVKSLRDPKFADRVADILQEYGLPPHRLVIELGKKTSMYDAGLIESQVKRMAKSGVGFSLDEFGQGYSSLGMLHLLPIQSIKIDRMFVQNINNDPVIETIINGLAAIAGKLELQLIAVGIETCEQREKMKLLKCDQLQGNFLYEPMTFAELRETMKEIVSRRKGVS